MLDGARIMVEAGLAVEIFGRAELRDAEMLADKLRPSSTTDER